MIHFPALVCDKGVAGVEASTFSMEKSSTKSVPFTHHEKNEGYTVSTPGGISTTASTFVHSFGKSAFDATGVSRETTFPSAIKR